MTPLRISIGAITVTAASGITARRLADGIPAALAQAVLRHQSGTAAPLRQSAAMRAAEAIVSDILRQNPDALSTGNRP